MLKKLVTVRARAWMPSNSGSHLITKTDILLLLTFHFTSRFIVIVQALTLPSTGVFMNVTVLYNTN